MNRDGNNDFVFVDCPVAPCQWIPSCGKCGNEVCGICGKCHTCEKREKDNNKKDDDKNTSDMVRG